MGASVEADAASGTQSFSSLTTLTILGDILPALLTHTGAGDTIDGTTYTEYYSFGKRVFSQNFTFKDNGILQASVGLAPVEVRVPVMVYPVGPLMLEIDGGVRFQAEASEQLLPTLMIGAMDMSSLEVKLSGNAVGSGFVEGYASMVALRGGVGGDVDLVDGQLSVDALFHFDGTDPAVQYGALLKFMDGELYAFADFFNPVAWGWDRFYQDNLYSWTGYCYAAGALSCPAK